MATRKCSSCGGPLARGTNVCQYCGSENIEVTATSGGKVSPGKDKSFDVILKRLGPNKIHVIKTIREFRALGLKESKELADNAPSLIKAKLTGEEAARLKNALEEVGAGAAIVEHDTDTTAYQLREGRAMGGTGTGSSSGCLVIALVILLAAVAALIGNGLLSKYLEPSPVSVNDMAGMPPSPSPALFDHRGSMPVEAPVLK